MANNTVFLYPGQGSQHVGMGLDLYQTYPEVREIFDRADRHLKFSLSKLCFEGPEKELDQDLNAQLAIYTLSCGLTEVFRTKKILPDRVSGYSSGFYSAAYAADCFDFDYGLEIIRRAGEILLDEGRKLDGNMAVIFGLPLEKVVRICQQVRHAEPAIHNTPRQIIISGLGTSIKKAINLALKAGALDAYRLSVATAYHSQFMKPGSKRFLRKIKDHQLRNPKVLLMSYLTLDDVHDKSTLKNVMAEQLSGPVYWVELIQRLGLGNAKLLIEVGPGAVISRTVRWIDRNIETAYTATNEILDKAIVKYTKFCE